MCATAYLTVMPSFSDVTDISVSRHSRKTDNRRTPLSHVAQYEHDIIGRELNLRKLPGRQRESNPQPSEEVRPTTIKTTDSAELATEAYMILLSNGALISDFCLRQILLDSRDPRRGVALVWFGISYSALLFLFLYLLTFEAPL